MFGLRPVPAPARSLCLNAPSPRNRVDPTFWEVAERLREGSRGLEPAKAHGYPHGLALRGRTGRALAQQK